MTNFHPKFPFGKGMWIWNLPRCEGGNIDKIIEKCKKYDINYVLIKSGDGENCFPSNSAPQLTREITDKLHANGISVYSWTYNYGYNPVREAQIALWSLEQLGVDGHVFDAEGQFERVPDPVAAAETLLRIVREKHPDAFLAHAPFPIIDYHTRFPYVTFGKYCDAVMPQVYWGTIGESVERMIADMYYQWSKWQNTWQASGHGDSIKPLIPAGQGYDNAETDFVLTPSQLIEFMTRASGYGSMNLWDWEHMIRLDLWGAVRDTKLKSKSELELSQNTSPNENTTQPVTNTVEVPTPTAPETNTNIPETTPPPVNTPENTSTNGVSENLGVGGTVNVPSIDTTKTTIPLPDSGKTTVVVKKDDSHPSGVTIQVTHHTPHIDYVIAFFTWLFSHFRKSTGKEVKIKLK